MLMPPTRKKKVPGIMRDVLAANVKALMEREFAGSDNKPMCLAKKADIALSSVQRTLKGRTGASIDTIEALSVALGVSPYQLILPGLDVDNPQVVSGATIEEKRLYVQMRRGLLSKPRR